MYPDTNQKLELNEWLRTCQYWYNRQLGERFTWWQDNNLQLKAFPWWKDLFPPLFDTKPSYYNQKAQLPTIKQDLTRVWHSGEQLDFTRVPSQTLQDVSKRVDIAFSRFLGGDSNSKRSGKPRFKNAASFSTIIEINRGLRAGETGETCFVVLVLFPCYDRTDNFRNCLKPPYSD